MDKLVYKSEYLKYYKYQPKDRKTPIYYIRPIKDDFQLLGYITCYGGAFRKYAFYPEENTAYDNKCLQNIAYFIENCAGKEGY